MKKTSNWFFWDWKSIFRTIVLFSGLFLLFAFLFLYPDWKRNKEAENYDGLTKGIILSIKPIEEISMSEYGNKTVAYFYTVRYQYHVNSKTYKGIDKIPNSLKNKRIITLLLDKNNSEIDIKYDPKKPTNSQLDF
ncbi:DUF3592 domain-containing protein [Fluviicola taffensis]|uniref:DUF3592 domain-containing protein n=1 Tax=Fluviicola taffensis (strain DSM 16823 / NCIMB 13979 / RW262) TaxID=755732 RepID=F2I9T2_FLUTR|nr:hypothetical protein [Fluviicola taffensis]AEA43078.1 hypothetical protein Fluta_1080 [Fluviicola taffensis DSM 16823]